VIFKAMNQEETIEPEIQAPKSKKRKRVATIVTQVRESKEERKRRIWKSRLVNGNYVPRRTKLGSEIAQLEKEFEEAEKREEELQL
jgi:hypothetical protein